ncbi:MAG: hypothetical protein JJE25_07490, partial [Bacteroidia bacterium]|nr:hypothetical protein [Bacteroidia bacterium]
MKKIYSVLIAFIVSVNAFSQSAAIDVSFNTSDIGFANGDGAVAGISTAVNASVFQSDGKLVIVGDFIKYNGATRRNIARLNSNGKLDSTFDAGSTFTMPVYALAIQNDGKILAANNVIRRFNSDGTLDASFNSVNVDNVLTSIAIQNDGKIVCGGWFTTVNSTPRNRIVRLNANGTIDATFNPGTGANSTIYSLVIQPDSNILIGGDFTMYNGSSRNRMARIHPDGTLDTAFLASGGANNRVNTIALQSDGKILAGGDFTSFTNAINRIVRLNTDGTVDLSFNPGTGANASIKAIAIQSDGKIMIGGTFTVYASSMRRFIARTNTDGSVDATFNPLYGLYSSTVVSVNTISIESSGRIIAGGSFQYTNTRRSCITGFNANGTLDMTYNTHTGVGRSVSAMAIQSDGKIIIGGNFGEYNGFLCSNIARLNTDGTLDTSFHIGTGVTRNASLGSYGEVDAIAIQSDGKIIIGGTFYNYNGTGRQSIARINTDGSSDLTFTPTTGVNYVSDGRIQAMAVQSDGKIIIGGGFDYYNSISRRNFARVNSDGSLDATFIIGTGAN